MINVTCVVKNEDKKNPANLVVNSINPVDIKRRDNKDDDCVYLHIANESVKVYGPDLIQAINNAMSITPGRRINCHPYRRLGWEDEYSDE